MTIQDPIKFCAGLWDWAILDGCFGDTKIKPMDIDGFIDRKGKGLYLETKAPGAQIPEGEKITFDSFIRKGDTVLVIWGNTNKPEKILLMTPKIVKVYEQAGVDTLRGIVKKWFEWANSDFEV